MTQDATALTEVHFAHCGQGDYPTTCKYGEDETCPALSTPIAALAQPKPAEDVWQPIETAPKDGTPILITRPTLFESEERWHVVRWDDDWWQVHCGKFDNALRGKDPTHWMPLPAPPARIDAKLGEV